MPQTMKSDEVAVEKEGSVLTFDIDGLLGAEITGISELAQGITASCYTYDPSQGPASWCSCNTLTCTWAECCPWIEEE